MSKPTILVVEPNSEQRSLLATLLAAHGYHVLDTPDVEEALRVASEAAPDLILGEHPLPLPHGDALCVALRSDPATAGIPFLALTSRAMPDEVDRARETHTAVLLKPVSLSRLLQAVEHAVDGRSSVRR